MGEPCRRCGGELCLLHCVYCGTECGGGEEEHAADCPSSTGVFPVTQRHGVRCSECGADLRAGDHYTERQIGGGDIPSVEPVCLGCAAREALNA